jgi:hypothetical protein
MIAAKVVKKTLPDSRWDHVNFELAHAFESQSIASWADPPKQKMALRIGFGFEDYASI